MWDATYLTDEDKQIAQFASALRKRVLTWYMNFTESQNRSKAEIKASFLAFFKTEDVAHLAA
jgi:predicted DNA-binding ribbon-helix-helix protein